MDGLFRRCGCGIFRDGCGGLANVSHDDVCGVGGTDPGREFDLADVEGITNLKGADIDLNGFWKVVRKAGDFDGVDVLLDESTGLDPGGFAVEVGRNVGGDRGVFVDGAEVGVERFTGEWIVLDGLEEGEAGARAFDVEIDDDVFRAAVGKEISEGFRIDLQVDVFGAFAVDHGGNPAFTAHLIETAGAGAGAWSCFERCLLGHDEMSLVI